MKKAQFLLLVTLMIPFIDRTTHAMMTKTLSRNKNHVVLAIDIINSIKRAQSLTRNDVDRFIAPGTIEEAYEYGPAINAYYERLDAIEQSYTNTPDVGEFLDNYNSLDGQYDDVMDQARAALEKTEG